MQIVPEAERKEAKAMTCGLKWKGRPVEELTKEELIAALGMIVSLYEDILRDEDKIGAYRKEINVLFKTGKRAGHASSARE